VEEESVEPSTAEPEIAGGVTFAGGPATTTEVAAEETVELPTAFVAVTAARSVNPMSPLVIVYVELVALPMFVQPFPPLSQRVHW
jgi:hypothetical protein